MIFRSAYETCLSCSGTGMGLNSYTGEPTHCYTCRGDGVVRARDEKGRFVRPEYCPCFEESPDPCPACGATVSGKDEVGGVCQARKGYRREPDVILVLTDKETGEVI